jgi:adenylyl cyclase-associated protein
MKNSVSYLAQACDDLGGLQNMGDLIQKAWEGIRLIIVLASRSKAPEESLTEALAPHMKPVQEAIVGIRQLQLDRDWDRHQKAVIEMLAGLSWVYLRPPQALPVGMVKETLGSAEFWSNRIRKDFKGKNDTQIAFCDSIKAVIKGLAEYIEEYHKTGLTFSPRGVSLAEAAIRLSDPTVEEPVEPQRQGSFRKLSTRHPMIGSAIVGGNMAGMMEELSKRKSSEGDSAATGLKKVR